ncbi:MAG: hypothetical protein ACOC1F_09405 [Myxococcota bacterium]
MAKLPAEEDDADDVREALEQHEQLSHLRVRRRADALLIESGPKNDPIRHARFRRMTANIWELDAANHRGQWEWTGHRALLLKLVDTLLNVYAWLTADQQ